jgi:hypothetical protein
MALPILRPLSSGEILDGAFTLYRRNFAILGITALLPAVGILAGFVILGGGSLDVLTRGDPLMMVMSGLWRITLIGFAAALVMWPALTRQVAQAYTGQPTSVADGFSAGARAMPPLLGSAGVGWVGFTLAGFVVGVGISVIVMILGAIGPITGTVGVMLAFLGYCAFVIVGGALLFAVVPAAVVEGAGPVRALQRSFTLARGALKQVVGVMTVATVIAYLPMMAVIGLSGGLTRAMNDGAPPSMVQVITEIAVAGSVGVLTTPFLAAVIVLLYFDRRVRTEALDVQMMADRLGDAIVVAGD